MAIINGTAQNDTLTGTSGDDVINGLEGNDVLNGGGGADAMHGGLGDDTYHVDNAGDTVNELAGQGHDKVVTTLALYVLPDNVEEVTFGGGGGVAFQAWGNSGANILRGGSGNDYLNGGAGADTMIGLAGDDTYEVDHSGDVVVEAAGGGIDSVQVSILNYTMPEHVENYVYTGSSTAGVLVFGNARDNIMTGSAGNDQLIGFTGNDTMYGGLGNDLYYVHDAGDVVIEAADEGFDAVVGFVTNYTLPSNVEEFRSAFTMGDSHIVGNGLSNIIRTAAGNDILVGGDGDDYLYGNEGADQHHGGLGNDTFGIDNLLDTIHEDAGAGWDTVDSSLYTYTLGANLEELRFSTPAFSAVHGIGNALNNRIVTNNGDDILDGKGGADIMIGWDGNDTYHVDHVGDVVEEAAVDHGGIDRVVTTLLSYTLTSGVEQLVFSGTGNFNGTGNAADNLLRGGSGNDRLRGMGGNDTMEGLSGDDIYWVEEDGDQVIEAANGGVDAVVTTLSSYILGAHVEDLAFVGPASVKFTGTGNALNNVILGGDGDDMLDGQGGADILRGGKGGDVYVVDNPGDQVVEEANAGWDVVTTTLSAYTLGANVEGLNFIGAGNFQGTGNDLGNVLVSGNGDDILDGGLGGDHMSGGQGNDIYRVDNAGDAVHEYAGEGIDEVHVTNLTAYGLGANTEHLFYSGQAAFQAWGNELDNRIVTGAGNDMLNGGAGADVLEGRAGNDIYHVDNIGDVVIEQANEGIDLVWATLSAYTLAANVENLTYGGVWNASFTATGNALNNIIETGEGADFIDGGAGADQMIGRNGNDVYVVDNLGDVVVEQFFGGVDEVRTAIGSRSDHSKMYVLPNNVENLTGTSATAQGVYANALDNVVKMGAGGDLIVLHDGGNDIVQAGGGNDFIYYGNAFTSADSNDGGAGFDTVGLLGHYTLTFGADDLVSIEKLALYSSGQQGFGYSYDITMTDANVAAGQSLMVVAQSLSQWETFAFNGSAETNGSFNIRGGKGADTIRGGAGNDQLWGNLGADILWGGAGKDEFQYRSTAESTVFSRDQILDFGVGDKINLVAIDADGNAANGNSKFTFIGENAFSGTAGQLRAASVNGGWLVEADTNGDRLADMSILVTTSGGQALSATDFWL